jgi:hypothetical protein
VPWNAWVEQFERLMRVLLVEPERTFWPVVASSLRGLAHAEPVADYRTARARLWRATLFKTPFGLLVTNMHLAAHNGLQLVSLIATTGLPTRSLVYTNDFNAGWGQKTQRAGAFYEIRARLPSALPAYLLAVLPAADRRRVTIPDRRAQTRGGRRRPDGMGAAPPGL